MSWFLCFPPVTVVLKEYLGLRYVFWKLEWHWNGWEVGAPDTAECGHQSCPTETALFPAWILNFLPVTSVDEKYAYNEMNLNPNQKLHINKVFFPVGQKFINHVNQGKTERRDREIFLFWVLSYEDVTIWPGTHEKDGQRGRAVR